MSKYFAYSPNELLQKQFKYAIITVYHSKEDDTIRYLLMNKNQEILSMSIEDGIILSVDELINEKYLSMPK